MRFVSLDDIGYEAHYYPRSNGREDWFTVHRYTDALQSDPEKQFPPLVVVKATAKPYRYLILDGLHRLRAYHRAGREQVPIITETLPESKWFARSVELNAAHGRCFDVGDKAFIATRLEKDGYPLDQIASLLQMTAD